MDNLRAVVHRSFEYQWRAEGFKLYRLRYTRHPYVLYDDPQTFNLAFLESENAVQNVANLLNCYATNPADFGRLLRYVPRYASSCPIEVSLGFSRYIVWTFWSLSDEAFYLEALLLG